MLRKMCREQLGDADVRAICKSRGFSAREATTRAVFENFFLSEIGVAAALRTLSQREIATLHLLAACKEEVEISFFARLYGAGRAETIYYGTYNQRYTDVMKQVQANLIRRGVLLFAEAIPDDGTLTRLQRLRFRFPAEFEPFLPPLVTDTRLAAGEGEVRRAALREKLLEIVSDPPRNRSTDQYALKIVDGELRMGQQAFRVKMLRQWQEASWEAGLPHRKSTQAPAVPDDGLWRYSLKPIAGVRFLCASLQEGQWAPANALMPLLQVLCYGYPVPDSTAICETGWQAGFLARQKIGGEMCYRLATADPAAESADIETYLSVMPDGSAAIALEHIPYATLERIAAVSDFRPASTGSSLLATPNLIRLGRLPGVLRDQAPLQWLRQHSSLYREACATVDERRGRQIIHTNLVVARITDPALRVQIARSLPEPGQLVSLSDEFVAFPPALLPIIERTASKAGHVIKTVHEPAEK